VPVEVVFDRSVGDIFVGRVAGNDQTDGQLGSMAFATAAPCPNNLPNAAPCLKSSRGPLLWVSARSIMLS